MITLALAAEDAAGAWLVRHITDRCLCSCDWIEQETVGHFRRWQEFDGREWFPLAQVPAAARGSLGRGFQLHGRFRGEIGAEDSHLCRYLFVWLRESGVHIDIVVVARDVDGTARRTGFCQAVAERSWPFAIVGAFAQPEAEAWFLCTWKAESDREQAAHDALRQRIGFDPVQRSHELTSTSESKRDAKQVLAALTEGGRKREQRFAEVDLETMRRCGATNGLTSFVDELQVALEQHAGRRGPPN